METSERARRWIGVATLIRRACLMSATGVDELDSASSEGRRGDDMGETDLRTMFLCGIAGADAADWNCFARSATLTEVVIEARLMGELLVVIVVVLKRSDGVENGGDDGQRLDWSHDDGTRMGVVRKKEPRLCNGRKLNAPSLLQALQAEEVRVAP